MTRKLATYVTVRDGNGRPVTFSPNDDHVPGWASAQITHAIAWAADEKPAHAPADDSADNTGAVTDDAPERPKRGRPRKAVQHADE
jgi:trehalose utilization protein